jgi:FkbM family methyltransferase
MSGFVEYKLKKKLRKRYARVASAVIRTTLRLRMALGLGAGRTVVTSRYGVRMRANWSDRTFQYCYFATYGRFLSSYLGSLSSEFVFLDIGANQGLYSLLAARNPRCRAAVALEPVPATFALLQANVAANGFDARVTCVPAALADKAGQATIAVQAGHSGTATLASRSDFVSSAVQSIELMDMGALDQLLPAAGPIVVKVDVEGFEDVVLAQLARSRHVARMVAVFYEMDSRWSEAQPLRQLLAAAGFDHFERHGRGRHYDVLATRGASPLLHSATPGEP